MKNALNLTCISAHLDLILKVPGVHKVPVEYVSQMLMKMRVGGKCTTSIKRILISEPGRYRIL